MYYLLLQDLRNLKGILLKKVFRVKRGGCRGEDEEKKEIKPGKK